MGKKEIHVCNPFVLLRQKQKNRMPRNKRKLTSAVSHVLDALDRFCVLEELSAYFGSRFPDVDDSTRHV
jgi:hypothetical protein